MTARTFLLRTVRLTHLLGALGATSLAWAVEANPSNYVAVVMSLKPGDTLELAPGVYPEGLRLASLNGAEGAPITVRGPASGEKAIIRPKTSGCCNTVEIVQSSHLVLENLTIDSMGQSGIFGLSAKDSSKNTVHHITVQGCTFVGQGGSQQTSAISTKTPTWGWVIRGNVIDGAGTGMYLGNSNGQEPFFDGLIEGNLIRNTIGYNLQIKYQKSRPEAPAGDFTTILRHNVFIKDDQPSPDGNRPNVLVGGFPDSGPGSNDLYQIYGNLFFHNQSGESLLQASGRVSIHDNLFVDAKSSAIRLQNHDLPLRLARVYSNTIYSQGPGIVFGSPAPQGDLVTGNLIFSPQPLSGPISNQSENLTGAFADASKFVQSPSFSLGTMDFFPLAGQCTGAPLDLGAAAADVDHDRDFNGTSKGSFSFRGAYAGDGENPGWQPQDGTKPLPGEGPGGGAGAGGSGGSGQAGAGAGGGGGAGNAGGAGAGAGGAGGAGQAGAAGGPGGSGQAGAAGISGSSGQGGGAAGGPGGAGGSGGSGQTGGAGAGGAGAGGQAGAGGAGAGGAVAGSSGSSGQAGEGPGGAGSEDEGGCSCRTGGGSTGGGWLAGLAVVLLGARGRRRGRAA
jgi:MYXO-CTERM domain-containing protein